jgi:hypothetical protein
VPILAWCICLIASNCNAAKADYVNTVGSGCCLRKFPKPNSYAKLTPAARETVFQSTIETASYKNNLEEAKEAYSTGDYQLCLDNLIGLLSKRADLPLNHDMETAKLLEMESDCYAHLGMYRHALCSCLQCLEILTYSKDTKPDYFKKIAEKLTHLASHYSLGPIEKNQQMEIGPGGVATPTQTKTPKNLK